MTSTCFSDSRNLSLFPPRYLNCIAKNPSLEVKRLPHSPVLDEHAVLRSAGCLQYASLPSLTRIPIVLDTRKCILQHCHALCHHAGADYVKAFLKQRFLIFGVRSAVRTHSQMLHLSPFPRAKRRTRNGNTSLPFRSVYLPH